MATVIAYAFIMERWNQVPKEVAILALHGAAQYTEVAFAAILGENSGVGGLVEASSDMVREHAMRLMRYWSGELKHKLEPFADEREIDTLRPDERA